MWITLFDEAGLDSYIFVVTVLSSKALMSYLRRTYRDKHIKVHQNKQELNSL